MLLGSYPSVLFKFDIPLSLRHVRYKRFSQKGLVESMNLKKFFWRKSAIVGIVWGFLSPIGFYFGGVMPFYPFLKIIPITVHYLLFFPLYASMLIIPESINNVSLFVDIIYVLSFILTPVIIGIIICVSFDYIISKIIKKVTKTG